MKNGVRLILETVNTRGEMPATAVKTYKTIDIENEELMKELMSLPGLGVTSVIGAEVIDETYDPLGGLKSIEI
jgi:hypothetical protein